MKSKLYKYNKISTYIRLNFKIVILIAIFGVAYNVTLAFIPVFQGKLINSFVSFDAIHKILVVAFIFILYVLFVEICRFFKRYFVRCFSNNITIQMRKVSFDNLMNMSVNDLFKYSKGEVINKNLSDINDSAEGIRKVTTEIFDTIVLLVSYFISLFIMDYKITICVIPFFTLAIIMSFILKEKIVQSTNDYKDTYGKCENDVLRILDNELYCRSLGVSDIVRNNFSNSLDILEKKAIKNLFYKTSFEPVYYFISLLGLFFVIYFSTYKVINGIWSVGHFTAYITTFLLICRKCSKAGKTFNSFENAKVCFKRCSIFLENSESKLTNQFVFNNSGLIIDNMSFGYEEKPFIKNFSLCIPNGQCIGICGEVHSGKSTLAAAFSGLYKYDGSIKLNGIEIIDLRKCFGKNKINYCSSNNEIFSNTIRFNIAFDNDADVNEAMHIAMIDDEVNRMDNKDLSLLSHTTSNLSGGQQKRLIIARSLYNNSMLTILDDPFNALDIDDSINILENIKGILNDKIFIIVTNQKELLKKVDKVIFLDKNKYYFDSYDRLLRNEHFCNLVKDSELK